MKDMKISSEEKKDRSQHSIVCDEPEYPYGLKIHFDPMSYKKLGMSEPPKVGTKVMLMCVGEVCDVSQNKMEGDVPNVSMGIQIMEVELKKKDDEKKDIATGMYGSDED